MFEPGRTYTLPDQGSVYVAELLPDGQLFLRDLNRGQFWRCGGGGAGLGSDVRAGGAVREGICTMWGGAAGGVG